MELSSPKIRKFLILSGLNSQNVSLKILIFFLEKTCSEKVSYIFSKKNFSNFQETELSYILLKKSFSYILGDIYSEPWHI